MYNAKQCNIKPRKKRKSSSDEDEDNKPNEPSGNVQFNKGILAIDIGALQPHFMYSDDLEPESKGENSNTLFFTPQTKDRTVPNYKHPEKYDKEEITPRTLMRQLNSKPWLTSAESKSFLKEYQQSKRYQEDNPASPVNEAEAKTEHELLLERQEASLPVPIEKADDEKFKLIAMHKMRKVSLPLYKSAKKENEMKPSYQDQFDSAIEYPLMKRKKIVNSVKKESTMVLPLYWQKKEVKFPLFIDKEIGIYEYWQEHMIKSNTDEDIATDNEQLHLAHSYTVAELKEAIDIFKIKGKEIIENTKYTSAWNIKLN